VNEPPGVPERAAKARPIKAQSAAVARATASICNAEWARFGRTSGHVGFVHTFSDLDLRAELDHAVGRQIEEVGRSAALRCMLQNSFSRHSAMPLPTLGVMMSRDRK
jgi:hypothetical protein